MRLNTIILILCILIILFMIYTNLSITNKKEGLNMAKAAQKMSNKIVVKTQSTSKLEEAKNSFNEYIKSFDDIETELKYMNDNYMVPKYKNRTKVYDRYKKAYKTAHYKIFTGILINKLTNKSSPSKQGSFIDIKQKFQEFSDNFKIPEYIQLEEYKEKKSLEEQLNYLYDIKKYLEHQKKTYNQMIDEIELKKGLKYYLEESEHPKNWQSWTNQNTYFFWLDYLRSKKQRSSDQSVINNLYNEETVMKNSVIASLNTIIDKLEYEITNIINTKISELEAIKTVEEQKILRQQQTQDAADAAAAAAEEAEKKLDAERKAAAEELRLEREAAAEELRLEREAAAAEAKLAEEKKEAAIMTLRGEHSAIVTNMKDQFVIDISNALQRNPREDFINDVYEDYQKKGKEVIVDNIIKSSESSASSKNKIHSDIMNVFNYNNEDEGAQILGVS